MTEAADERAVGLRIGLLSVELTVACSSNRVLDRLADMFRFFALERGRAATARPDFAVEVQDNRYTLWAGKRKLVETDCPGFFNAFVEFSIFEKFIERENEHLLLHAGAVACRNRGLILSGPKGCGKTSLAAGLLGEGFRYLADDTAALSFADCKLVPLPRPLHVKRPDLTAGLRLSTYERPAGDYQARYALPRARELARRPAAPAWLVFPRYRAGARMKLSPLGGGRAAKLLLQQAQNLHNHPRRGLDSIAALANNIRAFRLDYCRADQAARRLRELVKS